MTPPVLAASRFPVSVTTPDGDILDKARMVLTVPEENRAGRIMVWTRPGEPREDMPFEPAESTIGRNNTEWQIATPAGTYLVRPRAGCRCGPLARWEPFSPMTMGSLP